MKGALKWMRLLLLCLGVLAVQSIGAQQVTRGSYLQNVTHEAITIMWLTDSLTDSRVWYGPSPQQLTLTADLAGATHRHQVRIRGLLPNTPYYYAVGSTTDTLEGPDDSHRFHTNPLPGTAQPIKVWVIGDFGRNNDPERWVRDAYTAKVAADREADVWLWLGDNAYYNGTDLQYQTNVFDIYDSIFAFQPFWPTPGNHDYESVNQNGFPTTHTGPYYNVIDVPWQGEAGGLPSGGEMYYSFDYGNVHFVSLNSELATWVTAPGSPMAQWVDADLKRTQQPWKIVYFHQPPHSKGSHNSDNFFETTMISMRNNFAPLLEQNGVDLVLCGHSHVYERSRLMYGFYDWSWMYQPNFEMDHGSGSLLAGTPYRKSLIDTTQNQGTIYAVVGNSGSAFGNPALNHPLMYYGWGCDTCVGSLMLDINGDTLRGTYEASTGQLLDEFAIIKAIPPTGAPKPEPRLSGFLLWPNPFQDHLELQYILPHSMPVRLQLFTLQGQLLNDQSLGMMTPGAHFHDLDEAIAGISSGTYIVRLTAGDTVLHQKLIKQ